MLVFFVAHCFELYAVLSVMVCDNCDSENVQKVSVFYFL